MINLESSQAYSSNNNEYPDYNWKEDRDEEFFTEEQRDRIRESLIEEYSIYLLDRGIYDEEEERRVDAYQKEILQMDDTDLRFLETNGIFAYKDLWFKFGVEK